MASSYRDGHGFGGEMKLAPFLLDQWLQEHSGPQVEFNLGSSTGPALEIR